MIDYINQNLFLGGSVHKDLEITTDDGAVTITNEDLHQEKFELRESLCSESSLVFGSCESCTIKFTVSNIFGSLKGKWLTVSLVINHDRDNPLQIGRYKVNSDVPTANRDNRDVVAYDAMHDIISVDVKDWYNSVLPTESSTVTLREFRDSFFGYFDIEQEEVELPNDNMTVAKTVLPEELSGKTVLTAICEINGCFGNIGRNGKFRYVFLTPRIEGLYPSQNLYPSDRLFPRDPRATHISTGTYIPPCKYESYKVQSISGLLIRKEEKDLGVQVGTQDNLYIMQDNFLVYGKSTEELTAIADNILPHIQDIVYRPFNTKASGNPCLEIGDPIRLSTKTDRIETYIISRTLTGIQALKDEYTAEGSEFCESKVNTVRQAIIELKNKSNTLTRTLEETKSEIVDMERGLTSTITQTANKFSADIENLRTDTSTNLSVLDGRITAEVNRAENAEASLQVTANEIRTSVSNLAENTSTRFSQTDSAISAEVKRAGEAEASLQASINGIRSSVSNLETSTSTRFTQTDSAIEAEIERAGKAETSLQASINGISTAVSNLATDTSTRFTQTDSAITAEVTRAKNAESSLSTAVNGKVGASDVSSMIASEVPSLIRVELGQITISSGQIQLEGYVTANKGFAIDEEGTAWLQEYRNGSLNATARLSGGLLRIVSNIGKSDESYVFISPLLGYGCNGKQIIGHPYGSTPFVGGEDPSSPWLRGYFSELKCNRSPVITEATINSYLGSGEVTLNSIRTNVTYTSVGNINIMSTSGFQAESGYKYGNIAATGWVQGKVADLKGIINEEVSAIYTVLNQHSQELNEIAQVLNRLT